MSGYERGGRHGDRGRAAAGDRGARLAIAAFAVMFALSALVIAPLIAGGTAQPAPPGVQLPAGHDSHHAG